MERKTHKLKCWPEYFQAVKMGTKRFEVRRNDRDFQVGDTLLLEEYEPTTGTYTGERFARVITYILPGGAFGVECGFCVLGVASLIEAVRLGAVNPDAA